MSHFALLDFGSGGRVQSSKLNSPVSSSSGGGGGIEVESWVVSAAATGTTPGVVAVGGVMSLTLTSIHGLPQLGHSVSSAGRRAPQWMQTGRFEEVFVMVLRIRMRSEYSVSLELSAVSSSRCTA
ncbi:MAG: hypothetical protein DRJ28_01540 [Actinobacteria bacterium]|nr:MAG: hypothetical protein DRJ28_01540 [Actinomycetota bacterium]